jgi:hypothetical protein
MMTSMLYPLLAMVALTFSIMPFMLRSRIKAVKEKQISPEYFSLLKSTDAAPDFLIQYSNHFKNLFEVPVLFYAVTILGISNHGNDSISTSLAWTYVFFRLCHTLIHLNSNHVIKRMLAFMASNITLMVLWGYVGWCCHCAG